MKDNTCALLCVVSVLVNCVEAQDYHLKVVRTRITNQAGQEFACVAPYTISDCEKQVVTLQTTLHRFRAEDLGQWTWVLVHSEDWKPILERAHMTTGYGRTASGGVGFQGGGAVAKPEEYAGHLLELYGKCLSAVGKK